MIHFSPLTFCILRRFVSTSRILLPTILLCLATSLGVSSADSISNFAISASAVKGTFVNVPSGGATLTFSGTDPIGIADSLLTTTRSIALPAGLWSVRDEKPTATSLTVTGGTFANSNTSSNILAAADNYTTHFRQGTFTLSGYNPGQSVPMSQLRNSFDIGVASHGSEISNVNNQTTFKQVANMIATGDSGMWSWDEPNQGSVNMADAEAVSKLCSR